MKITVARDSAMLIAITIISFLLYTLFLRYIRIEIGQKTLVINLITGGVAIVVDRIITYIVLKKKMFEENNTVINYGSKFIYFLNIASFFLMGIIMAAMVHILHFLNS